MRRDHRHPDRAPARRPRNPGRPAPPPEPDRDDLTTIEDLEARAWRDQSWREFTRLAAHYDLGDA